jgi:hypothetical protein
MPDHSWESLKCPDATSVNGILIKEGPVSAATTFNFLDTASNHEDLYAIGGIKIRCQDYYDIDISPTEV